MNQIEQSLTSIEVAEMVGKQHSELLKDIRRYCEQLGEVDIPLTSFFTEGSYQSGQNKSLPCFLVTKKGMRIYRKQINRNPKERNSLHVT